MTPIKWILFCLAAAVLSVIIDYANKKIEEKRDHKTDDLIEKR